MTQPPAVPTPGDNTFFGVFFDYLGSFGEGLDGTSIELSHASIGADGNPDTQQVGRAASLTRRIDMDDSGLADERAVSAYDRELLKSELKGGSDLSEDTERVVVDSLREANLLSSALVGLDGKPTGYHTLAIDVDLPVRVRPTDTPGHYHLFIDAPMPWETYSKLLDVLVEAGIVEDGFAGASQSRGATHLRLPWIHKNSAIVDAPAPDVEEKVILEANGNSTAAETKLSTPEPGHIEWDPAAYDVQFVNGKGVLRRRK